MRGEVFEVAFALGEKRVVHGLVVISSSPEPLPVGLALQRSICPSLNFALDIARVMECLHSNGIIHRELKPGKVLSSIL
ncbi:hypothetical protein IFM89_024122 [Coptis chinensis]|uniref:Protein kinase domain-containing protein n=1 Tax=Coptis chinensis TaxID=261450 RepID=A0A835I5W1_9MAGN|nr:hypothetical protein IFM89_024122 [Coptis chinensis]